MLSDFLEANSAPNLERQEFYFEQFYNSQHHACVNNGATEAWRSSSQACFPSSANLNCSEASEPFETQVQSEEKPSKARERPPIQQIKRRSRQNFSANQVRQLEAVFEQSTHYPDWSSLLDISKKLKLPPERIQVWFQNRRAKFRRNANKTFK